MKIFNKNNLKLAGFICALAWVYSCLPAFAVEPAQLQFSGDGKTIPINQGSGYENDWGYPHWSMGSSFGKWIDGSVALFVDGEDMGIRLSSDIVVGGIEKIGKNNKFTVLLQDGHRITMTDGATVNANVSTLAIQGGELAGGPIHVTGSSIVRLGDGADLQDTTDNTIAGVTVSSGVLELGKADNIIAMSGEITVTGGWVTFVNSNQIPDKSGVVVNGGNVALLNGSSQRCASLLVLDGAVYLSDGATLELASSQTEALVMQRATINAPMATIKLATDSTQTIRFDGSQAGTAQISGTLELGGGEKVFLIEDGEDLVDMRISGAISESAPSSLIKRGAGALEVHGTLSHTGHTIVESGILSLSDTSTITFRVTAKGISNAIMGNEEGAVFVNGTFVFDMSDAPKTAGMKWKVVDMDALQASAFLDDFKIEGFVKTTDNIWTNQIGTVNYEFDTSSGTLSGTEK